MSRFLVQDGARHRLEQIHLYTANRWGSDQADQYIRGLFERFEAIADRKIPWRAVPAEFGVNGFVCRYQSHMIYWRLLSGGEVGIVTVLHERMHQIERLRDDFTA